jgi:TPR repeat protein
MYANGEGVPRDFAEAMKWLRKAADQGDVSAQFGVGLMWYQGRGVPQNYVEAAKWFRKAAEQGDALTQTSLGAMYRDGQGVVQNYAKAAKWYREAAQQGEATAQYELGVMYFQGRGMAQNYAEAVKWYRKAAEQGYTDAQSNLGAMYANGLGVPQDYNEAAKWYRLAADKGDATAANNLKSLTTNRAASAARQQRIDDARALTAEQWAAYRQLITRIEIGYKCGLYDQMQANVAVLGVRSIMDQQQIQNGLAADTTIDAYQEIARAVEQGRLLADDKSEPEFCSKFFSDPADRARLRQIVSDLVRP